MKRLPKLLLPIMVFVTAGQGIMWAIARLATPGTPAAIGDPGAYIMGSLIGVAVLITFGLQDSRVSGLEERIKKLEERNHRE